MIEWNARLKMYVADVASVSLSSCLESANLASGLPEVARPLSWVSNPSSADGFRVELNLCAGVGQAQLTGSWGDGVGPSTSDGDGLADAPMIPDADASATRDGILSTLYSSSFARNGSLSMWAKSTDVAERSTPDFPLACVLLKVSPPLGLGLVVAVS